MGAHAFLLFCVFATVTYLTRGSPPNCDEVRKVFQQRQIGPVKSLPERPRTGMNDIAIQFRLPECSRGYLACCEVLIFWMPNFYVRLHHVVQFIHILSWGGHIFYNHGADKLAELLTIFLQLRWILIIHAHAQPVERNRRCHSAYSLTRAWQRMQCLAF